MTDSKLPDQQAAAEAALTFMADAVAGGHMSHNIGFLESAYTGSLTQLVLGDDIVGWIRHFIEPIEITDEALGLDVIDDVGPGGLFLKHKHTRRHARDRFDGRVFDRRSRQDWAADGALEATARAAARVDEILATHRPAPLSRGATEAVHAVIVEAERRAGR